MQLTLFVDEYESRAIEDIRRQFNPEQYQLIKSHVTLCREDELGLFEKLMANLSALKCPPVSIDFGSVVRFSDGKGVLLPGAGNNEPFHQLRKIVLQGISEKPRNHEPHITLLHPRNATCTDELFEQIKTKKLPGKLVFNTISVIEQEAGEKWIVLNVFNLNK
jgi:2'-5' RNA ligase